MHSHTRLKGIAFDAYGTLFDVYSIGALAEEFFPGKGNALSQTWRQAQIDYTRIRAMSGEYADFWTITSDALSFCAQLLELDVDDAKRRALMGQYLSLDAFDDAAQILAKLSQRGLPLAVLSNGTEDMVWSALHAAKLSPYFDAVLSVDTIRTYKTDPRAYQLGVDHFGAPAEEIGFVSSNGWDICGASWFGFQTFWCNRAGNVLDRLGVTPKGEGRSLRELFAFVDD